MGSFLTALQFLTTIPLLPKRNYSDKEFGRAVGFFPLVGIILGGALLGVNFILATIFPETVTAALTLGCWLALTGALHFDGFLDTVDGLFGGWGETSRLEIMKDQRVGAFGLAAGFLLLLLKFVAIEAVSDSALGLFGLVLAPTLGRWGLSVAIFIFPYARDKGLGRSVKDFTTWKEVLLATLSTLLAAIMIAQWLGMIIMVISFLIILLCGRFTMQRIPGMTGDIYGAICEIIELSILLLLIMKVFLN